MPLISIVIPCYKGDRYLAAAIESCLRQTHRELEIIVVDDASPGKDAAIAQSYSGIDGRVRVIRHVNNGGVSRAFNTGFNAARGDYFTRLAQDDLFREDALAVMLEHMIANPDAGVVYCDMQRIDANGAVIGQQICEPPATALLPRCRIGLCVLWRRAVSEQAGPFDPRFDAAEDYEFFLRAARQFRISKCCGPAPFFMRLHEEQGGNRFSKKQDYAASLAQLAHHFALMKRHPNRIRHLRGVLGGAVRIIGRHRAMKAEQLQY